MGVGLWVGEDKGFPIGSGSFLHCFFSTVSYRLEPNGWGSKYPILMNKLYQEAMVKEDKAKLLAEVQSVHQELAKFGPDEVVWDIEDLSKQPPWGNNIAPSITSLANYFVTSNGTDLFEVLYTAIKTAIEENCEIKLASV